MTAMLFTAAGILMLLAASFHLINQTAGFFGSGATLLVALLCFESAWLQRARAKSIQGTGWLSLLRLGFRNAAYRPGRSVLCIALIASATFIIVAVDAFRRDTHSITEERKSGSGGFPLLAESLLPLIHDPNSREGREALNLSGDQNATVLDGASFSRFRLRPGDDASCLNLYQPRSPRILGATDEFIRSNRFRFQNSLADSSGGGDNNWLLLDGDLGAGVVPVIADANSLTYVLHLKLGDALWRLGQPQDAVEHYRRAAFINPALDEAHLRLGEQRPDRGGPPTSAACCKKLSITPIRAPAPSCRPPAGRGACRRPGAPGGTQGS